MNYRFLALPMIVVLAGCTSLGNPSVRSDYHETQHMGSRALLGEATAFDRLEKLSACWDRRARQDGVHRLAPWDRANREQAARIADDTHRLVGARDAVLGQKDLVEMMSNALRDLEAEFDVVIEMLVEGEAPAANLMLAADQKYLARRMQHSLTQLSAVDMSRAVEAADLFGRDVISFQQLLDAAVNGSSELDVLPPENPEVEESLAQIEELFIGYVADSAESVLENVVFRHDAWLALESLAALQGESHAAPKEQAPKAEQDDGADEAGESAVTDDGGAEEDEASYPDGEPDDYDEMPEGTSL
ncbi:MAG: hypothetical protein ACLGHG_01075 [Gammaproteobacteria bacterium]